MTTTIFLVINSHRDCISSIISNLSHLYAELLAGGSGVLMQLPIKWPFGQFKKSFCIEYTRCRSFLELQDFHSSISSNSLEEMLSLIRIIITLISRTNWWLTGIPTPEVYSFTISKEVRSHIAFNQKFNSYL